MCFHKENIRNCFDNAAHSYDQYCYPQQMIGDNLLNLIYKNKRTVTSIIDLGCGTGIITEKLASLFAYKNFHAIDISEKLLQRAKSRLSSFKIDILQYDFEEYNVQGLFDLVFANMSLHWALDFSNVFNLIRNISSDNSLLAFSIPLKNTFQELNNRSKNNFYNLSDVTTLLKNNHFEIIKTSEEELTFGFNSWVTALKTIRATGANYVFAKSYSTLKGRSHFISNKHPTLTYHIGYFLAKKLKYVT